MATHKENIMSALLLIPHATTKQIATLNDSISPLKKASKLMRELAAEKLVQGEWYQRQRLWKLTRKGKSWLNAPSFPRTKTDHSISICDIYFALRGEDLKRFDFEPRFCYKKMGKEIIYAPDALITYKKRATIIEVQKTPLSSKEWAEKWGHANTFFHEDKRYYESCFIEKYGKAIVPYSFIAITTQDPEKVASGFNIKDRKLTVLRDIRELT